MSYDIIYKKQFIKLDNEKFVPMILCGCNNVYETMWNGREKRFRSWQPYNHLVNGGLFGTLDEMLANANKFEDTCKNRYEDYDDSNFGSYISLQFNGAKYGSFSQYLSMIRNSCKNAKTIEELKAIGIGVNVENGYIYKEDKDISTKSTRVETTEELLKAIEETTEFYKHTNVSVVVTFTNHYEDVIRRINNASNTKDKRRASRIEKANKLAQADEVFVIQMPNDGYFVKLAKYGYRYTYSAETGKKFLTDKEAKTTLKRISEKGYKAKVKQIRLI